MTFCTWTGESMEYGQSEMTAATHQDEIGGRAFDSFSLFPQLLQPDPSREYRNGKSSRFVDDEIAFLMVAS